MAAKKAKHSKRNRRKKSLQHDLQAAAPPKSADTPMGVDPPKDSDPNSHEEKSEVTTARLSPYFERRVNTTFIVTCAVLVVVVAAGMHLLHRVQVDRNAGILLERATAAEADDRLQEAIRLLSQYVRLNPEDTDALAKIGSLVNRSENSVKAWFRVYSTFEEVLRRDPDRKDAAEIRWQLAQVAMKLYRFRDAAAHLVILRDREVADESQKALDSQSDPVKLPDAAELCFLQGRCRQELDDNLAAIQYYLASIQMAGDRVDPYAVLAALFLQRPSLLPEAGELQNSRQLGLLDNMQGFEFKQELLDLFPAEAVAAQEDNAATPTEIDEDNSQANKDDNSQADKETTETKLTPTAAQETSEALLNLMIRDARPLHKAYLARAQFRISSGQLDGAEDDLAVALKTAPGDHDVLLNSARFEIAQAEEALLKGQNDEAVQAIEVAQRHAVKGLTVEQYELRFYLVNAEVELVRIRLQDDAKSPSERYAAAAEQLRKALELLPKARKQANDTRDIRERDRSLATLSGLDVELRWTLCDSLISRAGRLFSQAEERKSQADKLTYGANKKSLDADARRRLLEEREELREQRTGILKERDALLLEIVEVQHQLEQVGSSPGFREVLASRSLISRLRGAIVADERESWHSAAFKLEGIRPLLLSRPALRRRVDLMLSECYGKLNNPETHLKVFQRALQNDPRWIRGRLQLAQIFVALNRHDAALKEYATLWIESRIAAVPSRVAAVRIRQQLVLPEDQRNWNTAEQALHLATQATPDSMQVLLLKAEVHSRKQEFGLAHKLLAPIRTPKAFEQYGESEKASVWGALALLELQRVDVDEPTRIQNAATVLQEARDQIGEHVALRLAAASFAVRQPPDIAGTVLEELEQGAEEFFGQEELISLWQRLAAAHQQVAAAYGQTEDGQTPNPEKVTAAIEKSKKLWHQVAAASPYDLTSRVILAGLALNDSDDGADDAPLKKLLAEIRRIEGPRGPQGNYLKASWQIKQIVQQAAKKTREATQSRGKALIAAVDSYRVQRNRKHSEQQRQKLAKNHRQHVDRIEKETVKKLEAIRQSMAGSLAAPRTLLDDAAAERPLWTAVRTKLGQLETLAENEDIAFDHYRRALSLGMRSRQVVGAVLQYLSRHSRWSEAKDLYYEVERSSSGTIRGSIAQLFLQAAFRPNEREWLQELAEATHENRSRSQQRSFDALLIFSQYQNLSPVDQRSERGKKLLDEAKTAFKDALGILPSQDPKQDNTEQTPQTAVRIWISYISMLAKVGDLDEVKAAIQAAGKHLPETPAHIRPLTQAIGYRLNNDLENAEAKYEEAVKGSPENILLRIEAATFYALENKPRKAQVHLDKVLDPKTNASRLSVEAAERLQATLLALGGTYADATLALNELRKATVSSNSARVDNLRSQAAILARRPAFADRKALIAVLEQIDTLQPLSPADRLRLARLYERTGNWPRAVEILLKLHKAQPADSLVIAYYIQGLIREKDIDEAETWLSRLEPLMPKSLAVVALKAKLLHARGDGESAAQAMLAFLDQLQPGRSSEEIFRDLVAQEKLDEALTWLAEQLATDDEAVRAIKEARKLVAAGDLEAAQSRLKGYLGRADLRTLVNNIQYRLAARLLFEFDQMAAAENVYRQYMTLSKRPQNVLVLIAYVAQRGQLDEALQLCEQAWKTVSPVAAANTSVAVLRSSKPTPKQFGQVEAWLTTALTEHPQQIQIAVHLADLRDLQGRYDESEALYRLVIKQSSGNLMALNNLAWLLAVRDKNSTEALKHIQQAIKNAGPATELLDTRATVYLRTKKLKLAIRDLNQVIEASPTPIHYLHLAQAHLLDGNQPAARQAFQAGRDLGLSTESLHPLERKVYKSISAKLSTGR